MKTCDYLPFLRDIMKRVLDFLVPESCLGCNIAGVALCRACTKNIPPATHGESKDVISLFDYRNTLVQKALWALKYKGGKRVGKIFGELLYTKVTQIIKETAGTNGFNQIILVPIPLSKERMRKRGFNQSEILAEEMSLRDQKKNFIVETSVLYRMRDTGSQALIKDRKMRINNVRGCFIVRNRDKIVGKNIILIDDITTTGATIEEAKRALVDNGAKRVIAFTVAH